MDILPTVFSPCRNHRSPRRSSRDSPRRSATRKLFGSPKSPVCGVDLLKSPVKIQSSDSTPSTQTHKVLFGSPPTPAEMRAVQMPATAPPVDRRSKRFDLSNWQRDLDNIAAPATVAPVSKASLFPIIGKLDVEMHAENDAFPIHQGKKAGGHGRTFSLSAPQVDDEDDEDSPFRVPSTARRANSLKHHRVSPQVSLVPSSASHGSLSTVSPTPQVITSNGRLSTSTSGAQLESLNETDAQSSFAPREPVLEQSIFSPVASTSSAGPTRSRAGSVSRIPVSNRSSDSLARARKAASMMDLARATMADNPLASSKKRNANGALVGGGTQRGSRLAAVSPIGPPSSSSNMHNSSPSAHAMRDETMSEDSDDEDQARLPAAIPRSRSQALPLHMRFSEPLPQTSALATPAACKIARPLQAAFMSTGLMSKRARASDAMFGGSPARGLPFAITPAESREMPLTPCKRPSLLDVVPTQNGTSPLEAQSGLPRPLLRTASSSSNGSTSDTSPTAAKAQPSSLKRVAPLMRRRSSGSLHDEPQTPTRGHGELPLADRQLAPTPTSRISPDGKSWPPAPVPIIIAGPRNSAPTPLTPFNPRASHPPHATRPNFRARHSNSALLTLRQRELSTPDRFESTFSVVRELGKGESSEAFAVQHREEGSLWAVKRTKIAYGGPRDRVRKLEEVDALKALSGGPHIVAFAHAWEQGGHLFIQTELCDGGTLAYFLDVYGREHEQLPEPCVWKILAEVSSGLAHIHAIGFLHLDLKPANIFLTAEGTCRIGDFGMATRWPRQSALDITRNAGLEHPGWDAAIWEAQLDAAPQPSALERRYRMRSAPEPGVLNGLELEREGDREYIAPEVLSGVYGREADVFSLGLIALEAATNVVLPDNGEPWRKLRDCDLSDVELSPLSGHLITLLLGMMHPSPGLRSTAGHVTTHPLIVMVRSLAQGRPAIVEESPDFLGRVFQSISQEFDAMEIDA